MYALNVKMHDELTRVPDSLYAGDPILKPGRGASASVIVKQLKLNLPVQNTGWVNAAAVPITPSESKIPNVLGMGLRDALYLLESQGLLVKPVGRGKVIKQSMSPGAEIVKGGQIIIELG